jgi:aryl-alcohol dehydrogenase-like predicted oxidoreductase
VILAAEGVCPRVELAPGYSVSRVITGCWQLAEDHGATSDGLDAWVDRWTRGVEAGFTTFDCADIYTGVEELLGGFLRRLSDPGRVQIHTKYVPDRASLATLRRGDVERAVDRSLRRLGREALDLVQFHWWDYEVPGYLDAAGWLAELQRAGKIRHLGVTNFDLRRLREIVDAGVEVVSAQVQFSVLDRRPESEFADWCRENGVTLLSYGTLAGGLLTAANHGAPDPGSASVGDRSLAKYRLILEEVGGWQALQEILDALAMVAGRLLVPLETAAIRWVLERPGVAAAIVGASKRDRLAAYARLDAPDWSAEPWTELVAALATHPGPGGPVYGLERDPASGHMAILRMNLNEPKLESEGGV